MIYVEFYELLGSPPQKTPVGWIGWDGTQFVLSDPASPLLQSVLSVDVIDRVHEKRRITSQEPEKWLSLLHTRYTFGSGLGASQLMEAQPAVPS